MVVRSKNRHALHNLIRRQFALLGSDSVNVAAIFRGGQWVLRRSDAARSQLVRVARLPAGPESRYAHAPRHMAQTLGGNSKPKFRAIRYFNENGCVRTGPGYHNDASEWKRARIVRVTTKFLPSVSPRVPCLASSCTHGRDPDRGSERLSPFVIVFHETPACPAPARSSRRHARTKSGARCIFRLDARRKIS